MRTAANRDRPLCMYPMYRAVQRTDIEPMENDPVGVMLRQVLHKCAQEMITDEQLERVLAPVKRMIMAGAFDKKNT